MRSTNTHTGTATPASTFFSAPHFVLLPPPPPPPEILHSQFVPTIRIAPTSFPRGESCPVTTSSNRTRQSAHGAGHLHAGDHQHHSRSPSSTRGSKYTRKRARTVKSVTASVAGTIDSCYKAQNYELQALLPCSPAQWSQVSFSLCATSRGTFTADVYVINDSSMKTVNLLSENAFCVAR